MFHFLRLVFCVATLSSLVLERKKSSVAELQKKCGTFEVTTNTKICNIMLIADTFNMPISYPKVGVGKERRSTFIGPW